MRLPVRHKLSFSLAAVLLSLSAALGDVRLDVVPFPAGDHYVKSITADNVDLMRNPLKVANGAEVGGVRITLARGRATLSGRTVPAAGGDAAVGGAGVLLIPADESLWSLRGARMFARSDAEGAFSAGVAPGDYLVFTWGPKDEPAHSIEDYVRSRLAAARRITLRPGDSRKADLPVNVSKSAGERD